MIIQNSPDLTFFDFESTWDLAGTLPAIILTNQSAGTGLTNCTWWAICLSPTQTQIHEGTENEPDITGNWSTHTYNDNWPRPMGSIEFSGAPYSVTLYVKDSAGNIYNLTKTASICRPFGNTNLSKNPYGVASLTLQVKCDQARIFFQDITNHSYQGLDGERITSSLKVMYPMDETGNIPTPFVMSNFSAALVPITYSSDTYQYMQDTVYDYDFGDGTHIKIRFQSRSKNGASSIRFPVLCNIDLCPLVCEFDKLINSIETGSCANAEEANRKLPIISSKLGLCLLGKQEPLCGINVPKLIEEIKELAGFDCDCCSAPTGIIPQTASIVDGYTFSIVPVCGDITGTVTTIGPNIQFNLQDKSYIFDIDNDSPQNINAFSVVTSTNGCTKTYSLRVDGNQLAYDLAYVILGDGNLMNLWNTIFQGTQNNQLIVDGGCIFQSTSTCDFSFTLSNIPINTTYALLNRIKIGSTNTNLNYIFNLTNLPGLQTYLNGLGYGTFTVTNPSGQTVVITSTANGTDIQSLGYNISNVQYVADYERNCTGFVAIDANQVVQNIIDYLCGLDDTQIVTSQAYTIKYLNSLGEPAEFVVGAGSTLAEFFDALVGFGGSTVTNIGNAAGVSCTTLKNVFTVNESAIGASDVIFGTKSNGQVCSQIKLLDLFNYVLTTGITNVTTKTLFCDFVTACGAGLTCAPYTFFDVFVTEYDTACTPLVGIEFTLN